MNIQKELDALVDLGITCSFVYGHRPKIGVCWSVNIIDKDGRTFDKQFAAKSLEECIEIIKAEYRNQNYVYSNEPYANSQF